MLVVCSSTCSNAHISLFHPWCIFSCFIAQLELCTLRCSLITAANCNNDNPTAATCALRSCAKPPPPAPSARVPRPANTPLLLTRASSGFDLHVTFSSKTPTIPKSWSCHRFRRSTPEAPSTLRGTALNSSHDPLSRVSAFQLCLRFSRVPTRRQTRPRLGVDPSARPLPFTAAPARILLIPPRSTELIRVSRRPRRSRRPKPLDAIPIR